jgi:hypothetical protein
LYVADRFCGCLIPTDEYLFPYYLTICLSSVSLIVCHSLIEQAGQATDK